MGFADLEQLLKVSMGLSAASIGSAAIERAVRERQSVCNLRDPDAYLQEVRASATELQALTEAVVVPESWFFRDRHAFTALARLAVDEWLPAHSGGVFSVLSLPCSTGEEPYSIAMALVDAGVPTDRFRIDAIDISTRHVAQAVRAVYGKNSFRGEELGFRTRHFDVTPDGFRVRERIRQLVRFQQGNLFATDFLPGVAIYHVIFCRNVLIYFDRPTQDRALGVLKRLLHARGTLFVAPAETGLPTSHDLISTKEPLAFAFRRAGTVPVRISRAAPPAAPIALTPRVVVAAPGLPVTTATAIRPADTDAPSPLPTSDLRDAARFADQGRFVEAASCCERSLRQSGPSATVFYLLGLVRDATGDQQAAAVYYRKALYLDPDHYDTQIHLALLLEKRGDRAAAKILRNRARRLEQKRQATP